MSLVAFLNGVRGNSNPHVKPMAPSGGAPEPMSSSGTTSEAESPQSPPAPSSGVAESVSKAFDNLLTKVEVLSAETPDPEQLDAIKAELKEIVQAPMSSADEVGVDEPPDKSKFIIENETGKDAEMLHLILAATGVINESKKENAALAQEIEEQRVGEESVKLVKELQDLIVVDPVKLEAHLLSELTQEQKEQLEKGELQRLRPDGRFGMWTGLGVAKVLEIEIDPKVHGQTFANKQGIREGLIEGERLSDKISSTHAPDSGEPGGSQGPQASNNNLVDAHTAGVVKDEVQSLVANEQPQSDSVITSDILAVVVSNQTRARVSDSNTVEITYNLDEDGDNQADVETAAFESGLTAVIKSAGKSAPPSMTGPQLDYQKLHQDNNVVQTRVDGNTVILTVPFISPPPPSADA